MIPLLIYIIGTIFTFYYETEDILLGKLSASLKETVFFSLLWPASLIYGAYTMWKEILEERKDPKCVECHNKGSVGHKMGCSKRKWK